MFNGEDRYYKGESGLIGKVPFTVDVDLVVEVICVYSR